MGNAQVPVLSVLSREHLRLTLGKEIKERNWSICRNCSNSFNIKHCPDVTGGRYEFIGVEPRKDNSYCKLSSFCVLRCTIVIVNCCSKTLLKGSAAMCSRKHLHDACNFNCSAQYSVQQHMQISPNFVRGLHEPSNTTVTNPSLMFQFHTCSQFIKQKCLSACFDGASSTVNILNSTQDEILTTKFIFLIWTPTGSLN